jgi:hypothetical protein
VRSMHLRDISHCLGTADNLHASGDNTMKHKIVDGTQKCFEICIMISTVKFISIYNVIQYSRGTWPPNL